MLICSNVSICRRQNLVTNTTALDPVVSLYFLVVLLIKSRIVRRYMYRYVSNLIMTQTTLKSSCPSYIDNTLMFGLHTPRLI